MASVMAIVSKAVFEKQARGLGEGDVWSTDGYASKGKVLETLADGGSLFLVTVRPPEELWLVGVLENPEHDGDAWVATANATPIRSIHAQIGKLVLANGNGLTYEQGKLGMSLQGPRVLADADVALLSSGRSKPAKPAKPRKSQVVAKSKAGSVSLDTVYAALDKGRGTEALELLLKLWSSARSPVLAEAIDVLSTRVGSGVIEGDSSDELEAAWKRVEKAGDTADLELLLAEIRAGTGINGVQARIAKLEKRYPNDPRLASFVHAQLEQGAYTASSSRDVWDAFFGVLERVHDPRTVGVVAASRARWDAKLAKRGAYHDRFLAAMDKVAQLASGAAVPEVSRDAIAPILAFGAPVESEDDRQLAALFAEVYKNPDDDHVRSVLADALVEKGDPRGDLIHLQLRKDKLSAAEQRRIKQLVNAHGREWLGSLTEFVSKKSKDLIYERGFATRITIQKPAGKHPAYPQDAPEMATIEWLDIGTNLMFKTDAELRKWVRRFPHVRRFEIGSPERLETLVSEGPVPYREIRVRNPGKAKWFTRANFPNLERVILGKGRIEISKDWTFKKVG